MGAVVVGPRRRGIGPIREARRVGTRGLRPGASTLRIPGNGVPRPSWQGTLRALRTKTTNSPRSKWCLREIPLRMETMQRQTNDLVACVTPWGLESSWLPPVCFAASASYGAQAVTNSASESNVLSVGIARTIETSSACSSRAIAGASCSRELPVTTVSLAVTPWRSKTA